MSATEIARTFNCGIGLIIFVRAEKVDNILAALQLGQEPDAKIIGKLEERSGARSVVLENLENWTHSKWYD